MKALIFDVRLNSLFSIRIPYTWQSALIYPVLPPSAVIGMLANALQRVENKKHPREYLKELESKIIWVGARLLSPCIVKSYTTSAIFNWKIKMGGKATNSLGREFGFTKNVQIIAVMKNEDNLLSMLLLGLKRTSLTMGDSESALTIERIYPIYNIKEYTIEKEIETFFPFPFSFEQIEITAGTGRVYMIHEKCMKDESKKNLPLITYIFPIKEENSILFPTTLKIKPKNKINVLELETLNINNNLPFPQGSLLVKNTRS